MSSSRMEARVDVVVKIGGSLLADAAAFDAVLAVVADVARSRRLLIVPGGGLFADAVREADRRFGLSDAAAHWMAILAMDQHAHLIASRLAGATLVDNARAIGGAVDAGRIPVLAPSHWLREVDALPHSWDATSDSIAAWVAGQVGASRLVLVKPPGVMRADEAVDPYFVRTLPDGVASCAVAGDRIDALRLALTDRR